MWTKVKQSIDNDPDLLRLSSAYKKKISQIHEVSTHSSSLRKKSQASVSRQKSIEVETGVSHAEKNLPQNSNSNFGDVKKSFTNVIVFLRFGLIKLA